MKTFISTIALVAGLSLAGAALAQPSGGPDAKGNAPLKPAHTVNDGAAKHGANSFTEGQAREHIEKSGFAGVTNLVKGDDGVWRGQAMRDGKTMDVALDFKGNVSTGGGSSASTTTTMRSKSTAGAPAASAPGAGADPGMAGSASTTTTTTASTMHAHHHHHRHHPHVACANPAPNGAACSGIDRNGNGISDKEDRAIKAGAHP